MTKKLYSTQALVLFSGGQDSTVCLAWALSTFKKVYTIGFSYGQRHHAELACREEILSQISLLCDWDGELASDIVLPLPFFPVIGDSALTKEKDIVMEETNLPNTFVPGRNIIFLSIAGAYAYKMGIGVLVAGMSEVDYSGYPDCRDETIERLRETLVLGMDTDISILTPLMYRNKNQIWHLARELGGSLFLELVRTESHTCYKNDRTKLHEWGYGCGVCPACVLRKAGYEEAFG